MNTERHREEGDMKAELGGPDAKDHQHPQERGTNTFSREPSQGVSPAHTFTSDPASRIVKEYISGALSYQVCSGLPQQPEETNSGAGF